MPVFIKPEALSAESTPANSRGARYDVRALTDSRREFQRFADDVSPASGLLDQYSIRFENHRDRFLQVGTGFHQRGALCVRSGHFLDESDVALWYLTKNGRELQMHDPIIRQ